MKRPSPQEHQALIEQIGAQVGEQTGLGPQEVPTASEDDDDTAWLDEAASRLPAGKDSRLLALLRGLVRR